MPYIREEDREGAATNPLTPGELNYAITKLCLGYVLVNSVGRPNYKVYNDVVGALESAKMEFYRRAVIPYENGKVAENGDVYR